eukprot:243287-Chlamydomonas_euryale.AAC.7
MGTNSGNNIGGDGRNGGRSVGPHGGGTGRRPAPVASAAARVVLVVAAGTVAAASDAGVAASRARRRRCCVTLAHRAPDPNAPLCRRGIVMEFCSDVDGSKESSIQQSCTEQSSEAGIRSADARMSAAAR